MANAIGVWAIAAVVGGAKISTKMAVLGHLVNTVDVLIIGGGMANTFLHAQGIDVGKKRKIFCENAGKLYGFL